MKEKISQLILIGGGNSIKGGLDKGLKDKIRNNFVLGCNYAYKFFPNLTATIFVDKNFYEEQSKDKKFKNLPLILGKKHQGIKYLQNTTVLKTNDVKYFRNIKLGCYKSNLVGLFALSLGIYLLDEGEIYLLGYDYGATKKAKDGRALTHFYQGQIKHRGIGKVNYFNTIGRADKDFGVYKDEKKVKIYNVSLMSKISTFPKISYDEFFKKLGNGQYNQEELRQEIKGKLNDE